MAVLGLHVRDAFYLLTCEVMNNLIEADPRNLAAQDGKGSVGLGDAAEKKAGCC